jgi:glyoxylase-like metal-dependent hydrolase (beta-lactamase superfamily II)
MLLNVVLVVVVILIGAVGVVAGPFLLVQGLPKRAEIAGMSVVKDGFVSVGVVPLNDNDVALVDAGKDPEGKAILAELARRGLGPDDVKVILVTHGHSDHIGAIAKFPHAQLMGLAAEEDVLEGRSNGGGPLLRLRSPRPTGVQFSRVLHDGDVLPLGPYQVRVFAVPGHTPGSAAYAIGEILFLGDSANHGRNHRIRSSPWIFTGSAEQNRKSIVELAGRLAAGRDIKTLVFGHSAPLQRGVAPLDEFARGH